MFLNVTGPFDNVTLKRYTEELQDEIEKIGEIMRVDIVGAPERESSDQCRPFPDGCSWHYHGQYRKSCGR